MRQLLLLALVWTAIVVAGLLLWPTGLNTPGCMQLITPSADCLAQVTAMNDRLWLTQTLPMLVFIASGYVVLSVLAGARVRHVKEMLP